MPRHWDVILIKTRTNTEEIEDIEEQQEHEIDNGEYDNEEEKEYERLLRGRR